MKASRKAAFDVRRLLQAHFRRLEPYAPIEPLEVLSQRVGIPVERIVKLDGNENPYGPSLRALEALRSYNGFHIYPDPIQRALRAKLAEYVGVAPGQVIAGNGSDEIIDLLMRLFLEPGDVVLNCPPSFGMYPFNTQVCAGTLVEIPRRADFSLDLEQVVNRAADPRAKLIFLTSPNNPTGNLLSRLELEAILAAEIMVVVDEAYQEFTEAASYARLVSEHENLAVLRTFSKWAGLAGLRVGYGVMDASLVDILDRIKPPYNVNVAALVAAEASLNDREGLMKNVRLLVQERERLFQRLTAVSYLEPLPSEANFILCRVHGRDAAGLKSLLEREGVFVKTVTGPGLENALRISVGKPEHSDALLAVLLRA